MNLPKFKFPGWQWFSDAIRTLSPIPLTLGAAALTAILWRGGWPIETAEQRIQFLGLGLLTVLFLLGLSLFLNRAGVSSFSVKAGSVEVSVNDKKDESS